MKHIIYTLVIVTVSACGTGDAHLTAIQERIKANALGQELHYAPLNTSKVSITAGQSLADWCDILEIVNHPDTINNNLRRMEEMISWYKRDNDLPSYHVWKFKRDRLQRVASMRTDAEAYTVVTHKYTIINEVFNNAKVEVTNHYHFEDGAIKMQVNEDKMRQYALQYIKTDLAPYEMALLHEVVLK